MVVLLGEERCMFLEFCNTGIPCPRTFEHSDYTALNIMWKEFANNGTYRRDERESFVPAGRIYEVLKAKKDKTYNVAMWNCQHFAKAIMDEFYVN